MLMSLGIFTMIVESTEKVSEDRAAQIGGHSAALVGAALFLGSFAGALVAIAIAPRAQWKMMGAVAIVVAALWAVYGQFVAGHDIVTAFVEAGGGILGGVAAYGTAQALFGRRLQS
jgi:hypothetical protein